jgi:hypothetical protein
MRLPGLWRARIAVAMAGVAITAVLAASSPAQAASSEESKVLALTNSLRASVGAPALHFDETLAGVARNWAAQMAANGSISHNPSLAKQVSGWTKLSENVGMGPNIEAIHNALVASRSHYVNMVDTEVTLMGIGVVVSGNAVFIVQNFMKPAGAVAPKAAPSVTSPPTTKPPAKAAPSSPAPAPTTTRPSAPTTAAPAPAPVAGGGGGGGGRGVVGEG